MESLQFWWWAKNVSTFFGLPLNFSNFVWKANIINSKMIKRISLCWIIAILIPTFFDLEFILSLFFKLKKIPRWNKIFKIKKEEEKSSWYHHRLMEQFNHDWVKIFVCTVQWSILSLYRRAQNRHVELLRIPFSLNTV